MLLLLLASCHNDSGLSKQGEDISILTKITCVICVTNVLISITHDLVTYKLVIQHEQAQLVLY